MAANEVTANGVTTQSGAPFAFANDSGVTVPLGTVFVVINNTAAIPIAGTFVNLTDGEVYRPRQ